MPITVPATAETLVPSSAAAAPASTAAVTLTPAVKAASEAEKRLVSELDSLEADIAAIEEDYMQT